MARFIKLHKEVFKDKLEIVEVYVNVEHITHVVKQSGKSKFTFVGLQGTFIEVTESTEEVMNLIRCCVRFHP